MLNNSNYHTGNKLYQSLTYLLFALVTIVLIAAGLYLDAKNTGTAHRTLGLYYFAMEVIVVFITGIALCVSGNSDIKGVKRRTIETAFAYISLSSVAIILLKSYYRMLRSGTLEFARHSRKVFYGCVLFLCIFEYIAIKHDENAAYLFITLIGLVLIFTDLEYNVIDEGAHVEIIQYIIKTRRFPSVYDNYEAVQGPVYYYLMALLLRWLPEGYRYMGARVFGLICFVVFGLITKQTIKELRRAEIIDCPDGLVNICWIMFVGNPNLLVRFTRVSNEALMCVLVVVAIMFFTRTILNGFNSKLIWSMTGLSAAAFLTKSTAIFIIGLVLVVCIYYKKYALLVKQFLLYGALIAPWFLSNYLRYGALTGMKGHLEFVLPIVNPEMKRPDIWNDLLNHFSSYFLNVEAGFWYDYNILDGFINPLLDIFLLVAIIIGIKDLLMFAKNKLVFGYDTNEKRKMIFMSYSALSCVSILMHTIQTLSTYNDSLAIVRYNFMLNGALCATILIAMSELTIRYKEIVTKLACIGYTYVITAVIFGYTEIITARIVEKGFVMVL